MKLYTILLPQCCFLLEHPPVFRGLWHPMWGWLCPPPRVGLGSPPTTLSTGLLQVAVHVPCRGRESWGGVGFRNRSGREVGLGSETWSKGGKRGQEFSPARHRVARQSDSRGLRKLQPGLGGAGGGSLLQVSVHTTQARVAGCLAPCTVPAWYIFRTKQVLLNVHMLPFQKVFKSACNLKNNYTVCCLFWWGKHQLIETIISDGWVRDTGLVCLCWTVFPQLLSSFWFLCKWHVCHI